MNRLPRYLVGLMSLRRDVLVREDEGGDLTADLVEVIARRNGGDGIQFDENEDGDVSGRVRRSEATRNDGAGAGLEQELPGAGSVTFSDFEATGNGAGPVVGEEVDVSGAP